MNKTLEVLRLHRRSVSDTLGRYLVDSNVGGNDATSYNDEMYTVVVEPSHVWLYSMLTYVKFYI